MRLEKETLGGIYMMHVFNIAIRYIRIKKINQLSIMLYSIRISLIALSVIFSLNSFSQHKISFGPDIALQVNFAEKSAFGNPNILMGSRFGVNGKYALNEHFSLSTGIYYAQKNVQYYSSYSQSTPSLQTVLDLISSAQGSSSFDISKSLDTDSKVVVNGLVTEKFFEIPLLCNYQTHGIVLFAGPYIGFLSKVKDKEIKETTIPFRETVNYSAIAGSTVGAIMNRLSPAAYTKTTTTSHEKNAFNKYDFGLTAGVGYQFKNLNFNVSYSQGFLDYREDRADNKKVVFRTLRFSVAYQFHRTIRQQAKQPSFSEN